MRIRALALGFAAVLAISACGSGGTSNSSSGGGTHPLLTVDIANAPATLDPGMQYDTDSYEVYRNIFDTLLHRDPSTLKVIPWVADSWKSVDPTTWSFQIHKGIKFQDGTELTGNDVAYSLTRILDKSNNSPQYPNFSTVKSASAAGDSVTITTNGPSPTLLTFLTTLAVVPAKYVQAKGNKDFNLHPMGSGPYELKNWAQGSSVDLTANPNYWKGKPPFDAVTFRAVTNVASRVADLQSGKADLATGLTPDNADTLKGSTSLQILATPTERVAYLAYNVLGPAPTRSLQLRAAISYAINYQSIIQNLLRGYGKPVKEVLTPLSFGYDNQVAGFAYDPQKAKQLLSEAGYNGAELEFDTSPAYNQSLIQAVQGDLAKVGINVKIVSTDQATYLKKVQSPTHDWGSIRFGRWSCSCLDADGTIYPLFRTGSIWSSYSNPAFDKVVDDARNTIDSNQRLGDYSKAFEILQKDDPAVGMYQESAIYGATRHLVWKPDPQESFYLFQMRWQS